MANTQVRDRIGRTTRSSILAACIASVIMSVGLIEGCAQKANATGSKGRDMIGLECRYVSGADLAALLGLKEEEVRVRSDAIYAIGYVTNRSGKMAYAKVRVIAKDAHGKIGEGVVSASVIAPNEKAVEPFVVKVSSSAPRPVPLDQIETEFVVEDVKFK